MSSIASFSKRGTESSNGHRRLPEISRFCVHHFHDLVLHDTQSVSSEKLSPLRHTRSLHDAGELVVELRQKRWAIGTAVPRPSTSISERGGETSVLPAATAGKVERRLNFLVGRSVKNSLPLPSLSLVAAPPPTLDSGASGRPSGEGGADDEEAAQWADDGDGERRRGVTWRVIAFVHSDGAGDRDLRR